MNQQELQERKLENAKFGRRSGSLGVKPSSFGSLHHPEMIFLGIDGGLDSYIAREAEKGNLPNFARLLKRAVRLTELRTAHPSITPACWSSITTGTTPEINGIISDTLHKGGKISDKLTAYNGNHLTAERFWEAAAKIGKTSLVTGVPVTAPGRSPLVRQCGGYSFYRYTKPDSGMEFYDVPMQLWFFDKAKKPSGALKNFPSVPLQKPSPVVTLGEGKFRLEMDLTKEKGANYRNIPPFSWELTADEEGFTLIHEEKEIRLLPESWAEPFFRELPSDAGTLSMPFRFGCFAFEDGFLILSEVTGDLSDVCTPEMYEITRKLPPPPIDKSWTFYNSPATARIAFDGVDHQNQWQIEMLRHALSKEKSDILVTYYPWPDTVNHLFWQIFSKCRSAAPELQELAEYAYKEVYSTADLFLGFLLDEVADENTTFLITSDHGSMGHTAGNSINSVLHKAGLLNYKEDGVTIDPARTKAASGACCHIWVNLQGREEEGIVPPEKYEETVYEIISVLQDNLRGPDGRSFLAFAVRREEAGFFGLGGENTGDVVFGLTAGYAAMTIHAEQIPSARGQYGNMLSMGLFAGPGIEEGKVLSHPCRTVDLAPTICELMGYPLPEKCCGASLYPLIKK